MHDPDFGQLAWNERLEIWEGSIRLPSGSTYELAIFARERFAPDRAISTAARGAAQRIRAIETAIRAYAARQLTPIYNQHWRTEGALSEYVIESQLVPEAIELHESGYAEVHYGDGGLFPGHSIGVRIRPSGAFQEAVLQG